MDGGLVAWKSSTGSTIPRPITWAQIRLTATLARNGFSGLVSHSANGLRASPPGSTGASPTIGSQGFTSLWVRGWIVEPSPATLIIIGPSGGLAPFLRGFGSSPPWAATGTSSRRTRSKTAAIP